MLKNYELLSNSDLYRCLDILHFYIYGYYTVNLIVPENIYT